MFKKFETINEFYDEFIYYYTFYLYDTNFTEEISIYYFMANYFGAKAQLIGFEIPRIYKIKKLNAAKNTALAINYIFKQDNDYDLIEKIKEILKEDHLDIFEEVEKYLLLI